MTESKKTTVLPNCPLLPRDYCSIERAADLLCCEVEDILQWGAEGAIPLMVNFDQWITPVYGDVSDSQERHPDEDGIVKLAGGRTWYELVNLTDDDDSEDIIPSQLGGFWCVLKSDIYRSFIGQPLDDIKVFSPNKNFTLTGKTEVLAIAFEHDNPFPTYWISRQSLIHLKSHIESGDALEPDSMLSNSVSLINIHPRAAVTAHNRELILAAAIYVKNKEEGDWFHSMDTNTETAKGWAYKIECNQNRLFEGKRCPLSTDVVARILSAAMNRGKPHKSN